MSSDPVTSRYTRADLKGARLLFDANAVRFLGILSESEWTNFQAAWDTADCTTGWVPHVLAEVMGTNLVRKHGLPAEDFEGIQSAVRRFDALADGEVLPNVDDVMRDSIYDLAGLEPPQDRILVLSDGWRETVEFFLRLPGPERVEAEVRPDRILVHLIGNGDEPPGITLTIERTFEDAARCKIASMQERLGHRKPVTIEQTAKDVVGDFPEWWRAVGEKLQIPKDVILKAAHADGDRVVHSTFSVRMLCENVYYHLRATGAKGKVAENDAPDLALTTYLGSANLFVSDDGDLRRLIAKVLKTDLVWRFRELVVILGQK